MVNLRCELKKKYDSAIICYLNRPLYFPHYIITAWNPKSKKRSLAQNKQANLLLEQELVKMINEKYIGRCIGASTDGIWQEESYWVAGGLLDFLEYLGKKYGQEAIYKAKSPFNLEVIWL